MKRILLFLPLVFLSLQSYAQCVIPVTVDDIGRGTRYQLEWDRVMGATNYLIEETKAGSGVVFRRNHTSTNARIEYGVDRTATVAQTWEYRVIAQFGDGTQCVGTATVTFQPADWLIRITRKSVIPIVGSTPGANGALFKTSLKLTATAPNMSGRLIYHPQGVPGSPNDPSIPYSFTEVGQELAFADIVAAFGQSGIGTIDIVPDGPNYFVPLAEVRLFNVRPDGGTFGTLEAQTQGFDFLSEVQTTNRPRSITVTVPGPELRLNLGLRTFSFGMTMVTVTRNGQRIHMKLHELFGDFLLFGSAADITGFHDLRPGDVIRIQAMTAAAVPFYTLTDNMTNDPSLFVVPVEVDINVGEYELP